MNSAHVVLRALTRVAATLLIGALAALPAHAQYVFWLDTHFGAPVLRRASPSFTGVASLPLPAGSLPDGLALARSTGQLVWTQASWSSAGLQKGPLTLASYAPLASGLSVLHGVAENSTTGQLYFTSSNLTANSSVYRCEADGSGLTTLLAFGASRNLRGIAVDPAAGKMFYTDLDNSKVFSANTNGTGVVQIANLAGGAAPWGIAVDPAAQQVYWAEFGAGRIVRASYTGASATALYTGLANPTYLALDPAGARIFWSEAGGTPRLRQGPIGGGTPSPLVFTTQAYGGVVFAPASVVDAPAPDVVRELELAPISPNPARAGARVDFALPDDADVRVTLTDVAGRRVALLAEGPHRAGRHHVALAPARGSLAPGLYFVRLESGGFTRTRRVALVP